MKKHKKQPYREEYIVKLVYQKPNGLWVHGHEETVMVEIKEGMHEKDNHEKAEQIIAEKYKHCKYRIVSVTYC